MVSTVESVEGASKYLECKGVRHDRLSYWYPEGYIDDQELTMSDKLDKRRAIVCRVRKLLKV